MKKYLIALAAGASIVIASLFFTQAPGGVGVELPDAPALFETSLAAPISSSATSLTLTTNSVRGGGTLSGYNCFTIDEGSSQAEFVCGTASSTSVTGLTRGISPSDGVTEVAALKFSHRRGASIKITDFPIIQILRNQNNGEATFENVLSYAASVVPNGANELADVGYVLSVVNGGTVSFDQLIVSGTAGETVATGTLVYLKASDQEWYKVDTDDTTTFVKVPVGLTQGPGTNGNAIGGGGILLMGRDTTLTGLTAGTDYYASSSAGSIGTTNTGLLLGRADDATTIYFNPHLDITVLDNTFSGDNTFTGTNTFSSTSTFSGDVSFTNAVTFSSTTKIRAYTSNDTWEKPDNLSYIIVQVVGGGGGGGGNGDFRYGGGGGYSMEVLTADDLLATTSVNITVGAGGTAENASGSGGTSGGDSSFGNFLSANGGGPSNSNNGGTATGGDLNVSGHTGINTSVPAQGGQTGGSIGSYGAGGGGAGSANAGTNGVQGIVIVTEYFN